VKRLNLSLALVALPALAQAPAVRTVPELRAFFQQNCVKCHGADGTALAPDGKKLKGQDFTNAEAMKAKTDPQLAKTIRKGVFFGLGMPAFKKQLSEEEALLMVREVLRKAAKGQVIQ